MRKELTTVDPGVQAAFQELLRRHPDVDAILLSTNDGVPLLRAIRETGGSSSTTTTGAGGGGSASTTGGGGGDAPPSSSSSTSLPLESLETKAAALFSIAADQARKMQAQGPGSGGGQGDGGCRSIVALYQGFTLVHINLAPLVLTFAAREPPPLSASAVSTEGAGASPFLRPPTNVGMILDSQPLYEAALSPLRQAVERQEREANSLRAL